MDIYGINEVIDTEYTADLVSCRIHGNQAVISCDFVVPENETIAGGILHYDSTDELRIIQIDTNVTDKGRSKRVTMTVDAGSTEGIITLRWTPKIAVMTADGLRFVQIICNDRLMKRWLDFRNMSIDMGDGYVLFPYITIANKLKFSYREASEYDGEMTRIKEYTALLMYKLFGSLYRRKKYYIVFEKFSKTAQDNSYYFFKYCMENLPPSERKRLFYIIDRKSPDYQYVEKYGRNVIPFMSIRHMIYAMAAHMVISTDTVQHLYAWKSKQNPVKARIMKKPEMFLQHGVTMLKNVDSSFGVKGIFPMEYFVTTSKAEQDIAVKHLGYKRKNAPILGFARWDALEDLSKAEDRTVLVMPTWRIWLENADREIFEESDYFTRYTEFFTSSRFREILEKNDMHAVLYLHPKFADRAASFTDIISDRIRLVPFGSERLNDLMMKSSILITDYSSVCWDYLFMNKPVLFYQFDYDKYMEQHGSYIDMKGSLPGPRAESLDELIDELAACIGNECKLPREYAESAEKYIKYRDKDNSRRTYEFIRSRML